MTTSTQRAYTLRLSGSPTNCEAARDHLWKTHEAVNSGVSTFADWLLTLRGGISHELVDEPVTVRGAKRPPTSAEQRDRRLLLALSWLTVESGAAVPRQYVIDRTNGVWATVASLRVILGKRGVPESQMEPWVADCQPSLTAAIAEGAVWVNRCAAFDDAIAKVGPSLTRSEVWDLIGELLGKPSEYLALPLRGMDGSEGKEEQPKPATRRKELREPARQWLSSRYGSKQGADFGRIVEVCGVIEGFVRTIVGPIALAECAYTLCSRLKGINPPPTDLSGIRRLLSGPGRKSGVINLLTAIEAQGEVSVENAGRLLSAIERDSAASRNKIGKKGRRAWSDAILYDVEASCGFRYRDEKDRVNEFSVMLDHAARRVSALHSWVKLAEQRRRELEADAQRIVPTLAATWLGEYCEDRSRLSGALEPYRIRRRAIEGWKEVLEVWAEPGCRTEQDRSEATRKLQGDADLRFGDIQLFEALACEEARCVWEGGDASILENFVARSDARARQTRYKVPSYRHPDPLRHPVFCDFGNSRWEIRFAAQRQPPAGDLRALQMGLFTGSSIAPMELRWHCKRLPQDLALNQDEDGEGESVKVTRANRLGRTAGGASLADAVQILGLFEEKYWNGRLQAPRRQLKEIADLCDSRMLTGDEHARRLARAKEAIRWTLTFSARLQPQGAWLQYANQYQIRPAWPHAEENKKRRGRAQLVLCRLPGLRVLSVDLGHRNAAACAVWQTVGADEVLAACAAAGSTLADDALHAMAKQESRTTLYRRTGASTWARLDRSFVIRLPGEQADIRKAGPEEIAAVVEMEQRIGRVELERPMQVAELMRHSLRLLRLALARHNRRAGISIGLASHDRVLPGGRVQTLADEERAGSIAKALLDWYTLANGTGWVDGHAKELWEAYISPLLKVDLTADVQGGSFRERKQIRERVLASLLPVAQGLSAEQRMELSERWRTAWLHEEAHWRKRLRWVKDWLLPSGHRGKSAQVRRTGGLSVLRLENFRALYRLQKAYAGRPRVKPEGHRASPSTVGEAFGQQTLDALQRLRENRVKQTASRIVAAALGLGKDLVTHRSLPCHAVVIENLTRYRPDETRTRRENRQLLSWCAARVGKYLGELCELYGLMVREVPAAYTSRQDSVTGAPGVRVVDVPVAEFFRPGGFWERELRAAERAVKSGGELARSRLLVGLSKVAEETRHQLGCVRLPLEGGPVFVSADRNSPAAKGLQADLNAAANIGLRALMDPDWAGYWWYIPCAPKTMKPLMDKLKGSKAIDAEKPLPTRPSEELSVRDKPVNLWRDVSAQPLTAGQWSPYSEYRVKVLDRVCAILREELSRRVAAAQCGLPF
jgi:hypothetical protein